MELSNIILVSFGVSAVTLQVFGQRWASGLAALFARTVSGNILASPFAGARAASAASLRGVA